MNLLIYLHPHRENNLNNLDLLRELSILVCKGLILCLFPWFPFSLKIFSILEISSASKGFCVRMGFSLRGEGFFKQLSSSLRHQILVSYRPSLPSSALPPPPDAETAIGALLPKGTEVNIFLPDARSSVTSLSE